MRLYGRHYQHLGLRRQEKETLFVLGLLRLVTLTLTLSF